MSSLIFDTHATANRYKSAGFTDAQVDIARETTALPDISTLATKADLERVGAETKITVDRLADATKSDLVRLEGRLDGKIDRVQAELKAAIATSQAQTVTLVLAGMTAIVSLSSVLPKLIR